MLVFMRLVYDVAVVVISVKATEWQLGVDLVFGFDLFCVVTSSGDHLMDLFFRDFPVVKYYLQAF